MCRFLSTIREFVTDEDGPTAVEYAVMLALIIVACIVAVQAIGTSVSTTFSNVATTIGGQETTPQLRTTP